MISFKKILSLLLLIASLMTLVSCERDREYNEAEVIAAAKELLLKTQAVNEIFYGKGFEVVEDEGVGIYKKASAESLSSYGVFTIDDIKRKTLEVFSDKRSSIMFSTVLESIKDEGVIVHYLRYYEHTDEDGNKYVMVNTDYDYHLKGSIEYLDGINVKDVKGEIIIIGVPVKLTSQSGKVKNTEIEIEMIEEEDGWRFNSPSEAVYNESTEEYENLNK